MGIRELTYVTRPINKGRRGQLGLWRLLPENVAGQLQIGNLMHRRFKGFVTLAQIRLDFQVSAFAPFR